jgi:hypothetical protein
VGIPKPEDGSSLAHWKTRRAIRNVVWLVGGLLIMYLLLLALHQSRENEALYTELQTQQETQVRSLAELLLKVQAAENAANNAGQEAAITFQEAIAALKQTFPPSVVDEAVEKAIANNAATTTTTQRSTTTTQPRQATTTTTAGQALPVPPSTSTTSTTRFFPTTTTTTKPCALGLDVPGIAKLCLLGG